VLTASFVEERAAVMRSRCRAEHDAGRILGALLLLDHPINDDALVQQTRPLPLSREAVAQTQTELTNAVLRVGSKIVRLVARTRRDRADVADLSVR